MKVYVTKCLLGYGRPFYKKPDIKFVGHPDPAVHLYALSRNQVEGFADFSFSQARQLSDFLAFPLLFSVQLYHPLKL